MAVEAKCRNQDNVKKREEVGVPSWRGKQVAARQRAAVGWVHKESAGGAGGALCSWDGASDQVEPVSGINGEISWP